MSLLRSRRGIHLLAHWARARIRSEDPLDSTDDALDPDALDLDDEERDDDDDAATTKRMGRP